MTLAGCAGRSWEDSDLALGLVSPGGCQWVPKGNQLRTLTTVVFTFIAAGSRARVNIGNRRVGNVAFGLGLGLGPGLGLLLALLARATGAVVIVPTGGHVEVDV